MSDRAEYMALKRLQNNPDYKVLEMKWLYLISKVEESRDKAASRASEGTWKYWAGMEKGAKSIVMALALAIKDLEEKDAELVDESKYDDLLREVRGEMK